MKALFLGGDLRQKYACDYLNRCNVSSEFIADFILDEKLTQRIKNFSIIGLPIPISKDEMHLNTLGNNLINIYDILSALSENTIVFGGKISDSIKNYFLINKINYYDYLNIESFQIQNALLTAEGAIYYAKQRLERSIHGSEIAILGFGRIGKILAYLLHSQGAKITVCARKDSDFTWSKIIGFNGFKIKISGDISNLDLINNKYDIIFNTIPFWIMDESFAKNKNSNTIIIDLASRPFGIDEVLVHKYNLNYYRELGIPGRYAPKTAGEIIGKTILNNIPIKED